MLVKLENSRDRCIKASALENPGRRIFSPLLAQLFHVLGQPEFHVIGVIGRYSSCWLLPL
jgi:hypothetical protein